MFDYTREKLKLDRMLEARQMSELQYQKALYYLNEANAKNQQNQADFAAHAIDGLTYNQREAELIKEYDANITQKKVNLEAKKRTFRNIWGFVALGACAIIAVIVINNITGAYQHRSVKDIPDPIQTEATGTQKYEDGFNIIELEYMHTYEVEGIIVVKEKDNSNNAYSSTIPFVYGIAWGYAAEHNSEITWAYNNRNLKAKDYKSLDRIKIQETSSINEIIPADETVRRDLDRYGVGDHVRITGNLVKAHIHNGNEDYKVESSEVRGDVTEFIAGGPTANEIIYATKIIKVEDKN